MTPFVAQLRVELTALIRNGEQLLLTIGIPVLLLVFFSTVEVLPHGPGPAVDFLTPGVLALATMSSSMVGLGIATGFQRSYLVLKRLGATPLGRQRLIGAKIAAVMAVQVLQFFILVPVALALGWRPEQARWLLALVGVLLGTSAFAGLGLLLAGRLRGEVNLAAQNGLFLVFLLLGGMVIPLTELPGWLATIASFSPSASLSDVLRVTLNRSVAESPGASSWIQLSLWAVGAPAIASRLFRWW